MAKKRGAGEGSIRQRPDGRWEARIAYWQAGRRKRKSIYGQTRGEVAQALTRALKGQADGLPAESSKLTVGPFLNHWLEHTIKPSVRPRTHQSYELLARLHILPDLGRIPLVKLTPEHVEALLARKMRSGLAPQTVRHIRTVLRRALNLAMKRSNVVRNVAALVDPPRLERRRQGYVLTADESRQFLTAAHGERLEPLFTMALMTGMRRGELLGLRWSDFDIETGRIAIQQSIQRYKGAGLKASDPKTDRSRRTLTLPQTCIKALKTWHTQQMKERLFAGSLWQDSGLIFTTTIGTGVDPRNLHRVFKAVLVRAKLPNHSQFHGLRHACASYLLSQGVPLRTISDLLGHSSISVTSDVYAHVAPQLLEEVARKMELLIPA